MTETATEDTPSSTIEARRRSPPQLSQIDERNLEEGKNHARQPAVEDSAPLPHPAAERQKNGGGNQDNRLRQLEGSRLREKPARQLAQHREQHQQTRGGTISSVSPLALRDRDSHPARLAPLRGAPTPRLSVCEPAAGEQYEQAVVGCCYILSRRNPS